MSGGSHLRDPGNREWATWAVAAAMAAETYGVRLATRCGGAKAGRPAGLSPEEQKARRAAVYLASVGAGLSVRALARVSGLDRKPIQAHLARMEDARDEKQALDAMLDTLTARLEDLGLGAAALARVA